MIFHDLGKYVLLIRGTFKRPEKNSEYRKEVSREMVSIGVGSLSIVSIISVFTGAVTTVQTAFQLVNNLIPRSVIGLITRDSTILELAPTITSLVLAGKIGSNISSQIGTMRVTEQIDALEVMGINARGYLILPKLIAGIAMIPLLVIIAMFLGILGGYIAGSLSGAVSPTDFMQGITSDLNRFIIVVGLVKAFIFGFIITSVSAYQGFYTEGGAREVGESGTRAVVISCILILCSDYVIAQLLL